MSRKILIKTIKKKLKKIVKPQGYIKGKKKRKSDLYDMVEFIRKIHIDDLNAKLEDQIRDRLKDKNEKLRIGFLVNEKAKWNCQSLLKEIQKNERMTAKIFLSLNERYKKFSHTDRTDDYLQHREFFMSIDKNLVDLYDYKKDWEKPIEEIDVDVLLYQQPWGMKDFPKRMAGRTLNVYMHYGFIMMANHSMHYNIGSFYPYLWKYFTQTEGHRLLHLNHDPSSFDKIVVTGYPKLDVYLEQESIPSCSIWKGNHDKNGVTKKIIYAPHHSVGKEKLKMSTFEEMHDVMLKIAKKERETQWVYKPHPRLEYSLIKNGLMSKSEYRKYVNAWDNLENAIVYDSGNYFDIFKSSDVLITDCGSFLAEYLPTENPIIWLVSKDSIGFNSVGAELVDCFYKARNTSEFVNVFQSIVNERHDPLKQKRLEAKELLFPVKGKSATAIVDFFESYFGLNNSY